MQVETPNKFVDSIEKIKNHPLSMYTAHNNSFSKYISSLYSKLDCGVPYVARNTKMNFVGTRTWRFECIFGGRARNQTRKSKKDYHCGSFIEFTITQNDQKFAVINFKSANWTHTHPMDKLFLDANGIISEKRIIEIREMALLGYKAREIRKKIRSKTIRARKFYDIRRTVKKNMQKNEINDLLAKCENYLNYFHIIHHWKPDNITKTKKYNGSAFISKRFSNLPIATDVVFMDDTCCVNQYDFPLVVISFEDYNESRQILAYSFIPGREKDHFKTFLFDVKNHIQNSIRVFIIDRWRAQVCAINEIFPEANIVFCKIHIYRNIRSVFGENSKVGSLFNQLIQGTISDEVYLSSLQKIIDSIKKHKRFLRNLQNELKSYSPSTLNHLQLRGHRTTNIQEGIFGTLKQNTNNDIVPLSELFEIMKDIFVSGIINSMSIIPQQFEKKVSQIGYIGQSAFNKLNVELKEAQKRIHSIMFGKLQPNQICELLNEDCHCTIKREFGLLINHDILENIKNSKYPYITNEMIPQIYLIKNFNETEDNDQHSETVDDPADMNIDFSYSNIMPKLSKIATHAKNNKDIQKNLIELFDNIQAIEFGNDYEPLTIHEKGRRIGRPSNCGAKKKKRIHHCSICGSTKHNKKTCHFKQYDVENNIVDLKNSEEDYEKEDNSNENKENENDTELVFDEPSNDNEEEDDSDIESIDDFDDDIDIVWDDKNDDNDNEEEEESENNANNDLYFSDGNIINQHSKIIKTLSKNQLLIIEQCPVFEKFLWQIAENKDASDRASINGVYFVQYNDIKNFAQRYMKENESPEIEAIKLIYEVNFNSPIPKEIVNDILVMCKTWNESPDF